MGEDCQTVKIMAEKYVVTLMAEERKQLEQLTRSGKQAARTIRRAQTLLLADEGEKDETIARMLHTSLSTIHRTRQQFVESGIECALYERHRPGGRRKLDGKGEAFLVATACSEPPEGRSQWTMQLLADRLVEVGVVESISDETVRRSLKQTK
jgi:transposase